MKRIAVITGASSGMGRRFAETVGEIGPIDELWVIARREERLEELRERVPCALRVLALDLSLRENLAEYAAALRAEQPDVALLINVLSYSRALGREVKSRGIGVTVLCPFWTRTEFFDRAIPADRELVVKKYITMYEPEELVERGWRDLKRGKEVRFFGFKAMAQVLLVKLLPHKLVMDVWMKQQKLG